MKTLTAFLIFFLSVQFLSAQNPGIGVGTTTPNASAALEIKDTAKGLLPPRMTTAQRNAIVSPAEGLIVYNLTTKCLDVYTGNNWISYCDGACYPPPATPNAGPDQNVSSGNSATLAANSLSYGTGVWTIESGVGGSIASPSSPTSTFTGSAGVSYSLKWTSSNACGASSDVVVITMPCPAGTANCNGNAADGCEINLSTSASNCGSCGNVCALSNATSGCVAGSCTVVSCNGNFRNCDGIDANGCEVNISSDINNCGSCGSKCTIINGTGVCNNGACMLQSCNPGFADCDGNTANGCELNVSSDANNCGSCGKSCDDGNPCTTDYCVNGVCFHATNTVNCSDGIPCTVGDVCSNGTCASGPISSTSCYISGQCYSSGQANPSNPCLVCNPSVSKTAWTNASNGTVCGTGKACSNGTCVTVP